MLLIKKVLQDSSSMEIWSNFLCPQWVDSHRAGSGSGWSVRLLWSVFSINHGDDKPDEDFLRKQSLCMPI